MIDVTILTNEELKYINDKYDSIEEYKKLKLKEYLKNTDYCVVKMYEKAMQGEPIEEMQKEYKEILINREEARKQINELENNKLGG